MHPEPPGLYIAAMRYLWIVGVAVLAALGAGCSTVSSSPTTTKAHHSTTPTTASTGPITPGPKDKTACTSLKTLAADGKSATPAELRSTLKAVRHADYKRLHTLGGEWAHAVVDGKTSAITKYKAKITAICTRMGLG
jgi:hypothetical protein